MEIFLDDSMIANRLRDWYPEGASRVETSAGGTSARLGFRLVAELHSLLSLYTVTKIDRLEKPAIEYTRDTATIFYYAKERVGKLVELGTLDFWKRRWIRVPLNKDEVYNLFEIKYEEGEFKAIKILGRGSPVCGGIFQRIGLTRHIIQQALNELSGKKREQTALRSIVCAARFTYAVERKLLPSMCAGCGRRDNFPHLLQCAGPGLPAPAQDPDPTMNFLKERAKQSAVIVQSDQHCFWNQQGDIWIWIYKMSWSLILSR